MKRRVKLIIALVMTLTLLLFAFGCGPAPDPETFTVTVVNGTGSGTYQKDASATVIATVPSGKSFDKWTVSESEVSKDNPYTFKVTADITVTANFKDAELEPLEDVEYYTVVVDGGIIVGKEGTQFKKGDKITVKAVAPAFSEFDYWSDGGTEPYSSSEEFEYTVTGNIKFTAAFTAVSRYELTLEGCTSESEYLGGVEYVTVTANTLENFRFVNWTINGDTVDEAATYMFELTEATTVKANFKRINIEITAESSNDAIEVTLSSDIGDPEPETYEEGDMITVTAAVRNGINLLRWEDADGKTISTINPYTFAASESVALKAVFGTIFTVKVEGGTLSGTDGLTEDIYGEGANCGAEATVGESQLFINWLDADDNVVSTANPYIFTVVGSVVLIANVNDIVATTYIFEAENADLTMSFSNGGGNNNVEYHGNDDHGDPILNASNKCSNGYIASSFNNRVDNVITWRINSDSAAKAILIMRMGNGSWKSATETHQMNLSQAGLVFLVNDNNVDYAPFIIEGRTALPGASNLSIYGFASDYIIAMEIDLQVGVNVIQMKLLQIGYGPNVDALKLTTTANLTWTPVKNGSAPIANYPWNV